MSEDSRSARVSRPRRNARPQVSSSLSFSRRSQPNRNTRYFKNETKRRAAVATGAGSGDPRTTCGHPHNMWPPAQQTSVPHQTAELNIVLHASVGNKITGGRESPVGRSPNQSLPARVVMQTVQLLFPHRLSDKSHRMSSGLPETAFSILRSDRFQCLGACPCNGSRRVWVGLSVKRSRGRSRLGAD